MTGLPAKIYVWEDTIGELWMSEINEDEDTDQEYIRKDLVDAKDEEIQSLLTQLSAKTTRIAEQNKLLRES